MKVVSVASKDSQPIELLTWVLHLAAVAAVLVQGEVLPMTSQLDDVYGTVRFLLHPDPCLLQYEIGTLLEVQFLALLLSVRMTPN